MFELKQYYRNLKYRYIKLVIIKNGNEKFLFPSDFAEHIHSDNALDAWMIL